MAQCEKDGKVYKHRSSFIHHEKIHTDEIFKCENCHKIYKTKKSLNTHKTSHTVRVISCEQCDEEFVSRDSFKRHVKRIHEEVTYNCAICNQRFSRKDNLKCHYAKCKERKNTQVEENKKLEHENMDIEFMKMNKNKTYQDNFEIFSSRRYLKMH